MDKLPDGRIFFPLPIPWYHYQTPVIVAGLEAEPEGGIFLKRPWLVPMFEHLSRFPPRSNIVRYHGCRARKGRIAAIQPGHVEGSNLFKRVRSNNPIEKDGILPKLASAVDYLHNNVSIAHNDIQPMNVMVSPDGPVWLDDPVDIAEPEMHDEVDYPADCKKCQDKMKDARHLKRKRDIEDI
ncbi:hypothetical protein B0T14DRAFT_569447 [Immersiella caudata]|uniref:Protein kinase domain-containing protein n=1 Tax=Immersiella caudata TaxID=314043 RepID=A0AA39WDH9_9PEZI|nr:hypothetical protein B0T14DRAFT_569447 [Immersiella caudata]